MLNQRKLVKFAVFCENLKKALDMASDESKFVNGTIIPCDGGWSAY